MTAESSASAGQDVQSPPEPFVRACAVLEKHGKNELVREIRRVQARPIPPRTVVVIGEVKRGKSSLVNSLLGRPDLAPVGVDIMTSAAVRFVPPREDLPPGDVQLHYPGGRHHSIPADELADWVTVDGARVRDPDMIELPIGARVSVDAMHLPGVTVVDTPGVNGLNPDHVQSTITAIDGATVLLMVCDATAPISAPELDFLKSVSTEIGAVVMAVTKIDQAMQSWRTIVDENRRLLAENAPRFAHVEIIGVSNLIAERAIAIPDPQRSKTAWDTSGIPALSAQLLHVLSDAKRIGHVNSLTAALTALDRVIVDLEADRKTAADAPRMRKDMTQERQRLQELKLRKKEWGVRLGRDLNKVVLTATARLRLQIDELTAAWNTKLDKTSFVKVSRASQALIAEMTVDVEALAKRVSDDYRMETGTVVAELLEEVQLRSDLMQGAFEDLDSFTLRDQERYSQWGGLIDPLMFNMMIVASLGIGAAIPVVGVVVGPAWGAIILGFRATKTGKEGLRKWFRNALQDVKEDLNHAIKNVQNELSTELRLLYSDLLDKSILEADARIKAADVAVKKSDEERATTIKTLTAHIGEAKQVKDELLQALDVVA